MCEISEQVRVSRQILVNWDLFEVFRFFKLRNVLSSKRIPAVIFKPSPHFSCISVHASKLSSYFLTFKSHFYLPGNVDDASTSEANIKEEPVDPIELRRLQQLTANSQFLNGNYQFPGVNGNGTTFTPLTPASVLHHNSHQPHVPGLKCRFPKPIWLV